MMRLALLDSLLAAPLYYAAIDLFTLGWVLTMLIQLASVSINCFIKISVCILLVRQTAWVISSFGCSITSSLVVVIMAGRYIEEYSKYICDYFADNIKLCNIVNIASLKVFLCYLTKG